MNEVPEREVGEFVQADSIGWESQHSYSVRIDDDHIVLLDGANVAGESLIESPPNTPWGTACDQAVFLDNAGSLIWHLGYVEQAARLRVIDRSTMRLLASASPHTIDWKTGKELAMPEWYELQWSVSDLHQRSVVTAANAGDSFVHLDVWSFSSPAGLSQLKTELYRRLIDQLDERIHAAMFVSQKRMLVLDDIGMISAISWPEMEITHHLRLLEMLRTDDDYVERIFFEGEVEDEEGWAMIGCSIGVLEGRVLFNVLMSPCFDDSPERQRFPRLRAVLVLDSGTMEPIGLVRPPGNGCSELIQVSANRFRDRDDEWELKWRD